MSDVILCGMPGRDRVCLWVQAQLFGRLCSEHSRQFQIFLESQTRFMNSTRVCTFKVKQINESGQVCMYG